MDGNHAMCPTQFRQLFVIQVPLGTASIPVEYTLMQDKRQSSCEEMFQAVVDKWEELGYSPDPLTVIVDFETGLRQALKSVFGEDLRIQGCFYHLTQATWRKVQELGLSELYKTDENFRHICGMLDGLAFLPVADVEAGMGVVRNQAMPVAEEVVDYFDPTYVTGRYRKLIRNGNNVLRRTPPRFIPADWNVHEATINNEQRTNNQCEGWNNRFSHLVGHQHPHIWKLIKCLRMEERAASASVDQQEIGNFQPRKRRRVFVTLQNQLQNLCNELSAGQRTIESFLHAVSRTICIRIQWIAVVQSVNPVWD